MPKGEPLVDTWNHLPITDYPDSVRHSVGAGRSPVTSHYSPQPLTPFGRLMAGLKGNHYLTLGKSYRLPITDYGLQITDHGLPITNLYPLTTTHYSPRPLIFNA